MTKNGASVCCCLKNDINLCLCLHQVAERNSIPLGLNTDWLHQHPHVLSGVTMDACSLPAFLPARSSAGQSGTACRGRTPLHDVSKVEARAEWKILKEKYYEVYLVTCNHALNYLYVQQHRQCERDASDFSGGQHPDWPVCFHAACSSPVDPQAGSLRSVSLYRRHFA